MELGRAIARDKSTVTPLIKDLQRRGLVERRPSETDRRSRTLRLTAAGEEALDQLLVHALEHDRRLDEIVGDRKAEFLDLLKRVAREIS
jgi:DNA-binding MarR family transcriptional regulator